MKIVTQCAASKDHAAGLMKTRDGTPVMFVANPEIAPATNNHIYARPDDLAENGKTWREVLLDYNANPAGNPLGLSQAWLLYRHGAYAALVERFGTDKIFILSAGWGLIRADFLTPVYDITFSKSPKVPTYKRRKALDIYDDLNMLERRETEPVVFFGGKDYLPQFCRLTADYAGRRIAVFKSATEPQADGVRFVRYRTTTRTNWHYEAVNAFLNGTLVLS